MAAWFLSEFVECVSCGSKLWFSPEGYVQCGCPAAANREIFALDLEEAVVNDLYDKLLNDGIKLGRITEMTNSQLSKKNLPALTAEQVKSSLKSQYDRIFKGNSARNKRGLVSSVISKIRLLENRELEITYLEELSF